MLVASTEAPKPEGSSGGLPQFHTDVWAGQIITLLILFAALYLLLWKVFIPRLRKVKDERDGAITGAIDDARRARTEADAQAAAVKAELAEARAKAQSTATQAKQRAASNALERQKAQEAELGLKLDAAETQIRAARDTALGSVRDIAAGAASAMVERLTGSAPAEAEVQAALEPVRS